MTVQHRMGVDLRPLWPFAVIATLAVVLVPLLAVLLLANIGLPEPEALVAVLVCLVFSIGTAAIGASMWTRRRESIDVAFGELMLWRFLRRHKAERTIDESAAELGLGPDWNPTRAVLHLDPDRALDVLHRLTTALEAKDPYTHGHSRRVERHVHRTAMAIGLSSDEIRDLRIAAFLHDVGKIRVPSRILRKPEALDGPETKVMREHVHVGAAMVAGAASTDVMDAIRHHHECWDGSGYPSGLAREAIPEYARIIAVADTYDALTSARPYKSGCGRKEAIDVLRSGAGVHFDPHVVDAFISTLPAALPAVSALLIFVTPERVARRIVSWARSSALGSVSTGAVAAGSAAAVITAGVLFPSGGLGGPAARRGTVRAPKAAAVELVQDSSDADADADAYARTHRETSKARPKRSDAKPQAGTRSADPNADNGSDRDVRPDASATEPDDKGNGQEPGNDPGGNSNGDDGPNGNGPPGGSPPGGGNDGDDPPSSPPDGDNENGDNENDDDGDDENDDDENDDDEDDDDEDCEPKTGEGHESHGEGHGHGHDHHCDG